MDASDAERDYFRWFDLSPSFDLDLQALAERYRTQLSAAHPDRFVSANVEARRASAERASDLNEAYRTLKDPLSRARYLLARAGIDTGEETDTSMDSAFLLQQMELRERLETVRGAPTADQEVGLAALAADLQGETERRIKMLSHAFRENSLPQARQLVRELQFFRRLGQEIELVQEGGD